MNTNARCEYCGPGKFMAISTGMELTRLTFGIVVFVSMVVFAIPPVASPARTSTTHVLCGVERWTVKTLQDRPALLATRSTTIAFLTSRPALATLPDTRLAFE